MGYLWGSYAALGLLEGKNIGIHNKTYFLQISVELITNNEISMESGFLFVYLDQWIQQDGKKWPSLRLNFNVPKKLQK